MYFKRFTILILIGILLIPSVISTGSMNDNELSETSELGFLTIEDLDWTVGGFSCDNGTLTFLSMEGFDYTIADELHFIENGNGTYYPVGTSYVSVGAYAKVPVINGMLNFSFKGRAKAGHLDAVNLALRVYNTDNMTWLKSGASHPDELGGIVWPGVYDTGYIYSEHNVTLEGLEEAIIFFSYNDYYAAVWEQEFWITDLKVETIKYDTTPNSETDDSAILSVENLNWTVGGFSCDNGTLYFLSMEGFDYSITDEIHIIETGNGTYYPVGTSYVSVGAYAKVPVINGMLNFSFKGRAKAGHLDAVNLALRVYNADNMTWLKSGASHPDELGGIVLPGVYDTGYIYSEHNVTLEGLEEAIIFFSYNDYYAAVWEQEFWVSDLKIEVDIKYSDYDAILNGIFTIPTLIVPITLAIIVLSIIVLKRKKR